jgi:hypothetical protein
METTTADTKKKKRNDEAEDNDAVAPGITTTELQETYPPWPRNPRLAIIVLPIITTTTSSTRKASTLTPGPVARR